MTDPSAPSSPHWPGSLIALAVFLAFAPTLAWQEFSGGSENLVVAAALEMRRGGSWMLPTLQGQPRLAKPPLATWITAAAIRPRTLQNISTPDAALRDPAYHDLAAQVRWPAVALSCLLLVAVYELALVLGGARLAIVATLICATNYAFLRFSRIASTDVPLALFVTLANLGFAYALFRGRMTLGLCGAGVALGLAFMSKGPVSLLQTIAPVGIFAFWRLRAQRRPSVSEPCRSARPVWPSAIAGLLLMLAIAVPWFLVVLLKYDAWSFWYQEVLRGSRDIDPDPWYTYAKLIGPLMLPWMIFFFTGLGLTVAALSRRTFDTLSRYSGRGKGEGLFVLLLLLVPVVVMSCFYDCKDRYLQPLLPAAAILAGWGLLAWMDAPEGGLKKVVGIAQYAIIVAAGVLFPLVGTLRLRQLSRADGQPWFSLPPAAAVAAACLVLVVLCIALQRKRPMAIVVATVGVMLSVQALFVRGYSRSADAMAETRDLAAEVWSRYPAAEMYSCWPGEPGRRAPEELSIYLNRCVRPVDSVAQIARSKNPQVLMIYYDPRKLSPPALPASWAEFTRVPRGKSIGVGYCRRPE